MKPLRIGDTLPLTGEYRITGAPLDSPVWFALTVAPQREIDIIEFFRNEPGIGYSFCPIEPKVRIVRGSRVETMRPMVSRLVFTMFRAEPRWHVMRERRRIITGVISSHGIPRQITRSEIRMIQGLPVTLAEIERERQESAALRPGDRATLLDGPLEGFAVEVQAVCGGVAQLRFLVNGIKGEAPVGALRREGLAE